MFSDHKNLVHAATQSESQILMHWQLLLKNFGSNIHHIYGVDNIVADMLIRFLSTNINQYDPSTSRTLLLATKIFSTKAEQAINGGYPLDLALL